MFLPNRSLLNFCSYTAFWAAAAKYHMVCLCSW